MLTIALGWFRWREAPHYLRNNLVTFAWFPFAAGLFFGATTRASTHRSRPRRTTTSWRSRHLRSRWCVNFAGVIGYQSYLEGSRFLDKMRRAIFPILSAELFSAVLTAVSLYFVVQTGTIGIGLLLVTLIIFQQLMGELLTSRSRGEELHRRATTDELTGLPNRERFRVLVDEKLANVQEGGPPFSVMLIDFDRFKEINDTLGHHYGDVLLRDVGPRLAACVEPDGVAARMGGDEFAVVPAERTDDPDELGKIAERLIECVTTPVVVEGMTLEVGASVGITRAPLDGDDVHTLLRRADVAMYAAKEEHASHQLYAAKLDRHSRRRLTVLSDFRRALETDELVVHYQPIIDIADSRPLGAEGLVRWEHPELGLLPPIEFIPVAEQSGLISLLTRHVLERAIVQCAHWRRDGKELTVSVNVSVRDLLDRDLPRHIEQMLTAHHLPAEALQVEITESMIMSDPDRAIATVAALRELGLQVAVDDFGTGYTSLANLKRLPITELKIDRSFVSPLLRDESDLIIVRSTINLGHDLGLNVIAEGVEDELTLKRLAQLGCDLAQGYHVSKPLPADKFTDWIGLGSTTPLPEPSEEPSALPARAAAGE